MAKHFISLKPTEQALLSAAATIYGSYVVAGRVAESTEKEYLAKSLKQAIQLAKLTDESVRADGEFD